MDEGRGEQQTKRADEAERCGRTQLLDLLNQREARDQLSFAGYGPYSAQKRFHEAGKRYRERLLMAGNQVGKTTCGAHELALHLTGRYPKWWRGRRFDRAIHAWAAGVSAEATATALQSYLIGGTPTREPILSPQLIVRVIKNANGVKGALDGLVVKHSSGQQSLLTFKSYAQGRESWQGASLDLVWFDEEPPFELYMEGLSRTNAAGGFVYLTFTPLQGFSEVVERFVKHEHADRKLVQMGLADAKHFSKKQRRQILDSYPSWEREARAHGIPSVGSGRIFPVDPDSITTAPFAVPDHWPRIAALDFGWDHPTAAVELAWDRDADCVYVLRSYRQRQETPMVHAAILRTWGAWLPWAWPHDGLQHEKGSGATLAEQYKSHGLAMMERNVTFEDGSTSVEAGLIHMLERMQSGRFKVLAGLNDWFEEFKLYHRKNGKVVKSKDDLMAATRYAIMGLRFAALSPDAVRMTVRQLNQPKAEPDGGYDPFTWNQGG